MTDEMIGVIRIVISEYDNASGRAVVKTCWYKGHDKINTMMKLLKEFPSNQYYQQIAFLELTKEEYDNLPKEM